MTRLPRKRRTREHGLADLSVNHVERHVLRCGWLVERMIHDYGIDLELFTFGKSGDVQEGTVLLQLKATRRMKIRPGAETFPFRIDRRDLVYWRAQPMPVILVLYDASRDRAYLLYVQSYFRDWGRADLFGAGKTVTAAVSTRNVLNPAAVRRFARFRDRTLAQIRRVIHDEHESGPLR